MDRISLDPGDLFIQAMEPFNIFDVVNGRDETVRLFSSAMCFVVSWCLETAGCVLRCTNAYIRYVIAEVSG